MARIRVVRQVELVVKMQRRSKLQDWAMKETSRHSRSPIFFVFVDVFNDDGL